MDKHTLSNYGFILVATILVAAVLAVLSPVTPFGDYVKSSINEVVDNYIEKTEIEKVENENVDIEPAPEGGDAIKKITINLLYEDGKQMRDPIYCEVKYGETLRIKELLPNIDGYTPTNIPKDEAITENKTINIVYAKNSYSIDYQTNGGTILSAKPTTYLYGETIALPTNVVKEGYHFAGWYRKSDFSDTRLDEITPQIKGDVVLYARWEKIAYNITYYSNGKEMTNIEAKYKKAFYGESLVLPVLPKQNGINFGGWYTNKYFSGTNVTATPIYPTGDMVFYAHWTNEGYTISYVENGGKFNGTYPTTYKTGQKVILPTNITRTGYTLSGWYLEDNFVTKVTEIKEDDFGHKMFYAKWTPAQYNIAYDLNGGSTSTTLVTTYTYNPTASALTYATNISKPGYEFIGWKDVDLGTIETKIAAGRYGNIVLIAQYASKTYNITYDANGGAPQKTNVKIKFGDTYGSGPVVSKDGYTLEGWYTESGDKVSSDDVFDLQYDITLYAHWTPATYSITYIEDGGTFNTTPPTSYVFGNKVTLPTSAHITKDRYVFDGWYKDSTYNEKVTEINANEYGDKVFYAKWTPATYSITYNLDGGSFVTANPVSKYTYGTGISELPVAQKQGYNFIGWECDGQIINTITTADYGNKVLKAKYQLKEYIINIVLVDESGNRIVVTNDDGTQEPIIFSQKVEYNTKYAFYANQFTELASIDNIYYHNEFTVEKDKNTCISQNKFSENISLKCYKWRILNVNEYYDNVYEVKNFQPQYRFRQDATPSLDIPEFMDGRIWKLRSDPLGGKTLSQYFNGALEKTIDIYYDAYEFNIIFSYDNSVEIPTSTLPTKYCYGDIPFDVPLFTKECYVFNGYTIINGTVSSTTSTKYSIMPNEPGDVTLKPNFYRSEVLGAHTDITKTTDTAATCKTKGWTKYTCSCGYSTRVQDIALNPSNHEGKKVNVGTSSVHQKWDCCGVSSGSHSYTSSTTNATCTAAGKTTYTCSCGYSYSTTIAKLGHSFTSSTYKSISSKQHERKCSRCSVYGATENHSLSTKTTDATCTAAGKKTTSCSLCSYSTSSTIAKLSHDFTKKCKTTHNPADTYTVAKTGWYCKNSSCYKYDSNDKYGHNSKPNPNFVHKACRYCEKNYGRRGCAAHESFSSSMTCKCTSHGSAWRCSNSWCKQYWTGGEDDWLNGEFETKAAW